jgi:hypothetical protein
VPVQRVFCWQNIKGKKIMVNFTKAEMEKDARLEAKKIGCTLKYQNATINGQQAYQITNRKTGAVVVSNCTLNSAYKNLLSGYVENQL